MLSFGLSSAGWFLLLLLLFWGDEGFLSLLLRVEIPQQFHDVPLGNADFLKMLLLHV